MIKRTLYFGNPCYLRKQDNPNLKKSVPIEDIGIILIDHRQISLAHSLISALMENNTAVISCDKTRKPQGLMLPMYAHIHIHRVTWSYPVNWNLTKLHKNDL